MDKQRNYKDSTDREIHECIHCKYYGGAKQGCIKTKCTQDQKPSKVETFCGKCSFRNMDTGRCLICMMKILKRLPKEIEDEMNKGR